MVVDGIAERLVPSDPRSARTKVLSVYAMMLGTLQLSRALTDRRLSDVLLEEGIHNALTAFGIAESR